MKSKAFKASLKELEPGKSRSKHNADNTGFAALTHYLYLYTDEAGKNYKQNAVQFLKEHYKLDDEKQIASIIDALREEQRQALHLTNKKEDFTFIDLFAGVGGFRIAMQNLGGKCVFTSEWDKAAQHSYYSNYGEYPFGDITQQSVKDFIPKKFDVLCAGFPCQAFSIAGRRGGFEDTRGTLFFDVAEIIKKHQPQAVFLENVKGLFNHDKGNTLETILNVLRNDLGYFVPEPQIVNAKHFGVPQNRERIFIVGFRKDLGIEEFKYPKPSDITTSFKEVKEKQVVPARYYLSTQYLKTLKEHKARHKSKGNGFGFEVIKDNEIANAIVVGGMGRERNLVHDARLKDFTPQTHIRGEVNREGIRKMTPRERARLQGFPDEYKIVVADASAYKQFGNSVAVPAIQAMGKKIIKALKD